MLDGGWRVSVAGRGSLKLDDGVAGSGGWLEDGLAGDGW